MTEELIKEATKYIDSRFKQEFFSYWDLLYSIIDVVRPREKRIAELEKENTELKEQIEKIQEELKADLIANLKERMQYSTSPSCTKGMELFVKSIEEWEIKEND